MRFPGIPLVIQSGQKFGRVRICLEKKTKKVKGIILTKIISTVLYSTASIRVVPKCNFKKNVSFHFGKSEENEKHGK